MTREIRRGPRGVTLTQMPETGALESGDAPDTARVQEEQALSWRPSRQAEEGREHGGAWGEASGGAGTTQLLQGVECQGRGRLCGAVVFLQCFHFISL